jgi:hypothetical protein
MQTLTLSAATAQMILDEELDIYDVLADRETRIMPGDDVLLQEMYDNVARDNGLHPDDEFEEILEIMLEQIAEDYG